MNPLNLIRNSCFSLLSKETYIVESMTTIKAVNAVSSQKVFFDRLSDSMMNELLFRATSYNLKEDIEKVIRHNEHYSTILSTIYFQIRPTPPENKRPSIYVNMFTNEDEQIGHLSLHLAPIPYRRNIKGPLHIVNNRTKSVQPFFISLQNNKVQFQNITNKINTIQTKQVETLYEISKNVLHSYFDENHELSLNNSLNYFTQNSTMTHPLMEIIQKKKIHNKNIKKSYLTS